jgi:hypothetical protein
MQNLPRAVLSVIVAIGMASICMAKRSRDPEVESLIKQLGADQRVSTEAARKLATYGGRVVADLIYALKGTDSRIRMSASSVLAMLGEDSIPDLIDALKDRNKLVREHAVLALNRDALKLDGGESPCGRPRQVSNGAVNHHSGRVRNGKTIGFPGFTFSGAGRGSDVRS